MLDLSTSVVGRIIAQGQSFVLNTVELVLTRRTTLSCLAETSLLMPGIKPHAECLF